MSDEPITVDMVIKEYEKLCLEKHEDIEVARQLMEVRYPKKELRSWDYFECLKAVIISDGSIEDATVQLNQCLRQYVQRKSRRIHQKVRVQQEGCACSNQ